MKQTPAQSRVTCRVSAATCPHLRSRRTAWRLAGSAARASSPPAARGWRPPPRVLQHTSTRYSALTPQSSPSCPTDMDSRSRSAPASSWQRTVSSTSRRRRRRRGVWVLLGAAITADLATQAHCSGQAASLDTDWSHIHPDSRGQQNTHTRHCLYLVTIWQCLVKHSIIDNW